MRFRLHPLSCKRTVDLRQTYSPTAYPPLQKFLVLFVAEGKTLAYLLWIEIQQLRAFAAFRLRIDGCMRLKGSESILFHP